MLIYVSYITQRHIWLYIVTPGVGIKLTQNTLRASKLDSFQIIKVKFKLQSTKKREKNPHPSFKFLVLKIVEMSPSQTSISKQTAELH